MEIPQDKTQHLLNLLYKFVYSFSLTCYFKVSGCLTKTVASNLEYNKHRSVKLIV